MESTLKNQESHAFQYVQARRRLRELLTVHEYAVAKNILNVALAYSAQAFSQITNVQMRLRHVDLDAVDITVDELINHYPNGADLKVLKTEVRGQIPGESYLIFSKEEALEVARECLSPEHRDNPEMHNAILLEVDNILTASVVTQFSNFFDVLCYGDVPHLLEMNKEKTEKLIRDRMDIFQVEFTFRTSFITEHINVSPEFIWIFKDTVVGFLKRFASQEDADDRLAEKSEKVQEYIR